MEVDSFREERAAQRLTEARLATDGSSDGGESMDAAETPLSADKHSAVAPMVIGATSTAGKFCPSEENDGPLQAAPQGFFAAAAAALGIRSGRTAVR